MANSWKRRILTVIVMMVITIGLIWLETYKRQREQYNLAEKYFQAQDYPKAMQCYDSAIHMYTPWSTKVQKSAEKLFEIGQMYEKKQEFDMALNAYRYLRSSFYAVRWLVQPYKEWIQKSDDAIARVLREQDASQSQPVSEPSPAQEKTQ